VLFALSDFDGTRRTYKLTSTLTPYQVEVAAEVLEFFKLDYLEPEIRDFCRYLSYKTNKVRVWMDWIETEEARHIGGLRYKRRGGECGICGTPAKICQFPERYAKRYGWENDVMFPKQTGLCIVGYIRWLMNVGIFRFNYPTGWKLIDKHIEYLQRSGQLP